MYEPVNIVCKKFTRMPSPSGVPGSPRTLPVVGQQHGLPAGHKLHKLRDLGDEDTDVHYTILILHVVEVFVNKRFFLKNCRERNSLYTNRFSIEDSGIPVDLSELLM